MSIELTPRIEELLKSFTVEREEILKSAWDFCCDGQALLEIYGDIIYDPWDGEHEDARSQIEMDAVIYAISNLTKD